MGMFVLVGVDFIPMPMFMAVYMGMLVGMPVLVFMGAFHINTLLYRLPRWVMW
jgi:hypothetical protein